MSRMQHAVAHTTHLPGVSRLPASTSPSRPQSTSLDDQSSQASTASHKSHTTTLDTSTTNISQSSYPGGPVEELTPPSSAASPQKQLRLAGSQSPTSSETIQSTTSHVRSRSQAAERPGTHSPPRAVLRNVPAGAKRTASGEVKRASINGIGDLLPKENATTRPRTSSILSNGSNSGVVEVSHSFNKPWRPLLTCSISYHSNFVPSLHMLWSRFRMAGKVGLLTRSNL